MPPKRNGEEKNLASPPKTAARKGRKLNKGDRKRQKVYLLEILN
jgi:hypothetical protein